MGKINSVSLTDILANFELATTKVAEEGMPSEEELAAAEAAMAEAPSEVAEQPVIEPQSEEELAAAMAAAGGELGVEDDSALVDAAKAVVDAEAQEEMAVENLKAIAKEAQDSEASLLQKEASEFGRLFASEIIGALEQFTLKKEAEIQEASQAEAEEEATVAMNKIAEEAFQLTLDKIAEEDAEALAATYGSIVAEAYAMTKQAFEDAVTEEQKKRTETGEAIDDTKPLQAKAEVVVSEPDEQEEVSEKVAEELTSVFEQAYQITTQAFEAE